MPIPLSIPMAGSKGVNKDLSSHELPDGVWTDANNVRFLDGYCVQFTGDDDVYGTPPIIPYNILPVEVGSDKHWVYAGASAIYSVYDDEILGVTHTDLSGAAYSGGVNQWTSTLIGGVPVFNNGSDAPQRWDLNLANNFQDLDNWPANTSCESLRTFGSFLIALNVTKSGTKYPYMVKWSHPAGPGEVPSSWDHTDPDYDAGEKDLGEGYGAIIDGLQLRDYFMIYRESSIWRMDLVGGQFIFNFTKVLGTSGAMNRNCIVEVDGLHFVLTSSDVVVHDGQRPVSVLDKVSRRHLFTQMDSEARSNAFVFKNPFFNEVYVCYPAVGSTICDRAMVWNYVDKTVSFRDMPNVYHAAYGPVAADIIDAWSAQTATWGELLRAWNDASTVPGGARVLLAADGPSMKLLDGKSSVLDSYAERVGMNFGDSRYRTLIVGIFPRIDGDRDSTVKIKVGGTDTSPYDAPTYDEEYEFTIGRDTIAPVTVERRYVAVRIENVDSYSWQLDSFDIVYEEAGEW